MKKLLLTLMACLTLALALPRQAHALTAADLDGLYYGAYMVGMENGDRWLAKEQFAGQFVTRNGQLYMADFWRGFDMPVTITNDGKISLSTEIIDANDNGVYPGEMLQVLPANKWGVSSPYVWALNSYGNWQYIGRYTNRYFYGYQSKEPSEDNITLELMELGNSSGHDKQVSHERIDRSSYKYRLVSDKPINVTMTYKGELGVADGDGLRIYVFDTNASAKEYTTGGVLTESYGVGIDIEPENPEYAVIRNFGQCGINFHNYINGNANYTDIHWVDASLDYKEGTVLLDAQYLYGDVHFRPVSKDLGYGRMNNMYNLSTSVDANWYESTSTPPLLEDFYISNVKDEDYIIGRITGREPKHYNVDENHWHKSHGGQLETRHMMNLEFDNLALWSTKDGLKSTADLTVYETPYDYEYTHDATLSLSWFAQNETQFGFGGTVSGRVKSKYIDSYDLYVIPGMHKSIEELTTHHDTGIEGAELLAEGITNVSRSADDENGPVTIPDMLVKRPESIDFDPARNYTLFLKANYNNGLHPTYHAMTEAAVLPTGVGTIMDDGSMVTVRPVAGGVEVEGYDGMVEVYSVAGTCVFSGVADGLIELSQGTYIVRAAQRSWKVNVN